jgi:hypothetical protein
VNCRLDVFSRLCRVASDTDLAGALTADSLRQWGDFRIPVVGHLTTWVGALTERPGSRQAIGFASSERRFDRANGRGE